MEFGHEDIAAALGDSSRRTADLAAAAAGKDPGLFKEVLYFCLNAPYPLSMRAARVITLCCEADPELILPYINEVLDKFLQSDIIGVRRGLLKICSGDIDLRSIKEPGILLNYCFDCLLDNKEPYATRVYSMEILNRFCDIEPDLKPELKSTIEFIFDESPPSIKSRARRILKSLKN